MNSIAIKVNSFKTQNEILVNGNPVAMNSEFMNYYSKPIVNVVDKLFETAEIEFNDYFNVEVYGNKFEQALVALMAKKFDLCENVALYAPTVNLSLSERLSLIAPYANSALSIGVTLCTDNAAVALPVIDNLRFVENPSSRVIVSDDMDFIRSQMDENNRVAFLIGGESRKHGKSYIIGCTADEVPELIQGYLATCFVNPMIHKVVQTVSDASCEANIADCVEPYFYIAPELQINVGDTCTLPLFCYPKESILTNIRTQAKGSSVELDGLTVKGIGGGTSAVELFNNSPIPFATVKVEVIAHNLSKRIDLAINTDSNILRTGTSYDLTATVYPADAEDIGSLKIEVSDKHIAHIDGDKLIVDKPGTFNLIAKTSQTSVEHSFLAKSRIEKIKLSDAPKKIYIGDVFEIHATVSPADVYDGSYKWTTSDNSVAVVGKDGNGRELVKIKGVGKATISCISTDDETVVDTIDIYAESTFNKRGHSQTFLFIGVIATIVALFLCFNGGASTEYWIALGASFLSLLVSLIRKEGIGKAIFFMLLAAASIIVLFI